jgi:hypothetical protein
MKIHITREEIQQVLSGYFHTEVEDFIIDVTKPSMLGNRLRKELVQPEIQSLRIINCKSLRKVAESIGTPINLPDIKWALENWTKWIEFVDVYNRLPVSGYGSEQPKGILR